VKFAGFMRTYGTIAGRIGETIESILVEYTPVYARAYPGFYIASGVPELMSGKPVDWAGNVWQVAVFSGFDASLNLVEDAVEKTAAGGAFKKLVIGGVDRVFGSADRAATELPADTSAMTTDSRVATVESFNGAPEAGTGRTVVRPDRAERTAFNSQELRPDAPDVSTPSADAAGPYLLPKVEVSAPIDAEAIFADARAATESAPVEAGTGGEPNMPARLPVERLSLPSDSQSVCQAAIAVLEGRFSL